MQNFSLQLLKITLTPPFLSEMFWTRMVIGMWNFCGRIYPLPLWIKCLPSMPLLMLMVLILLDGEELIPSILLLKVLITCNMLTLMLMGIGRLYGVRKGLIASRLSCGWLYMSAFSQMFVGASGKWEYHPHVLVVGVMTRILSMCCVTVCMQLMFGFDWFRLILLLVSFPSLATNGFYQSQ